MEIFFCFLAFSISVSSGFSFCSGCRLHQIWLGNEIRLLDVFSFLFIICSFLFVLLIYLSECVKTVFFLKFFSAILILLGVILPSFFVGPPNKNRRPDFSAVLFINRWLRFRSYRVPWRVFCGRGQSGTSCGCGYQSV